MATRREKLISVKVGSDQRGAINANSQRKVDSSILMLMVGLGLVGGNLKLRIEGVEECIVGARRVDAQMGRFLVQGWAIAVPGTVA